MSELVSNLPPTPTEPPPWTLRVALALPLRRLFDYQWMGDPPPITARVVVPLGRQEWVGWVCAINPPDALPLEKQRAVVRLLDREPIFTPDLWRLLQWAARYYSHPLGEVISTALPKKLRDGAPLERSLERYWRATPQAVGAVLSRAPKQQQLLARLLAQPHGLAESALLTEMSGGRALLQRLVQGGWVEAVAEPERPKTPPHCPPFTPTPYSLHPEQEAAITAVRGGFGQFGVWLLEGVTGSGKTEVYLQLLQQILQQGRQGLVLVPEIGLTPQLVRRFTERLNQPVALLHSRLSDGERLFAWQQIQSGERQVVIGTRSALFAPLDRLGLIVIDEEHDGSFKQQDHWRYSARDVAIKRAQLEQIPILLGSATPSLESWHHAEQGRYRRLRLTVRAAEAVRPTIHLIDLRHYKPQDGLSQPLLRRMEHHLAQGRQVLLFLNRRGYAPVLFCHDCRWSAHCDHCDSHLTLYQQQRQRLHCHHCGREQRVPSHCPVCQSTNLHPVGAGTERLEERLQQLFPEIPIVRLDRDRLRQKDALEAELEQLQHGERQIIVGTQLITKGHHLPNLTLVGVVLADQGLFSIDFRAGERLIQQLLQVAGRAGREALAGEVLIQTHAPEHPLFHHLRYGDYGSFAAEELAVRRLALLPPLTHLILIRVEARLEASIPPFMQRLVADLQQSAQQLGVELFGPLAAPLARRNGFYRWQLLLQAPQREPLQQLLQPRVAGWEGWAEGRKVRWSVDVDPLDLY